MVMTTIRAVDEGIRGYTACTHLKNFLFSILTCAERVLTSRTYFDIFVFNTA